MTLEMCSLPTLPYKVSGPITTTGFGVPIFCGGYDSVALSVIQTCCQFDATIKKWIKVKIKFQIIITNFFTYVNLLKSITAFKFDLIKYDGKLFLFIFACVCKKGFFNRPTL